MTGERFQTIPPAPTTSTVGLTLIQISRTPDTESYLAPSPDHNHPLLSKDIEDEPETKRPKCDSTKILIGITVVSLVTTAALVGILMWRELRDDENGPKMFEDRGDEELNENTITSLFPGFFRTSEQQEQLFERYIDSYYYNRTNVTERHTPNNFCLFGCEFFQFQRKKRQMNRYILHGCCKSWVEWQAAPTTMKGIDGSIRTILRFKNYNQFLMKHHCSQETGCTGCACSKERVLFSAVVHKKNVRMPSMVKHVEVSSFLVEGACRCVNR